MSDDSWPPAFACASCGGVLQLHGNAFACDACGRTVPVVGGIPRFIRSGAQASFALQWKRFADVQLDSKNGTSESRDRLLVQSGLAPEEFAGRSVLEVGAGAGRFTEVLLSMGAQVMAVDYSEAIEALATSNAAAIASGQLAVAQADVFALPFAPRTFDIVVGYGMLQHTGAPRRALSALWELVRPGGVLLVDRYALDLRHFLPFKYALRPITRNLPPERLLRSVERLCAVLVPAERMLLRRSRGGLGKWIRYVLGRAPNSTFPLNLEVKGQLDPQTAFRWSVLDTFDQYSPRYDLPCTAEQWRAQIAALSGSEALHVGTSGQGHVAVVRRPMTSSNVSA
jgi:2-polyprenyl-3-methyl-5-hydroxy-6-metoxy-1,4-benzoquinol methylase